MPLIQKNLSRNITTIIVALIVIGYIAFNFRIFIAGPSIDVLSPISGTTSNEKLVLVNGVANQINYITLNGRSILINEKNEFKEFLLLNDGYNIITLEAKDKFGRQVSEKIEIVYQGQKTEMKTDMLSSTSTLQQLIGASSTDSGQDTLSTPTSSPQDEQVLDD